MKIIFMGTPEFSVGALEAIINGGHNVVLVVTQPDKPKGRGKGVQMTPVKECALKYNIPVFQPLKIKEKEAVDKLREYEADVFVVAAFGQFLSEDILNMPKYGCINIHASLLPKYRGAAPIQRVILDGEKETGITIMQMAKGIDTGDILLQESVKIEERETGDSLHDKLAAIGAELIVKALPLIEKGELVPVKQDDNKSSYAKMLNKSMGEIDWHESALVIERMVRGLNSWPGTYTHYSGKVLKIWESEVSEKETSIKDVDAGTVTEVDKDAVYIRTGDKDLKITQVQFEGKKRMPVKEFLLGCKVKSGERFI